MTYGILNIGTQALKSNQSALSVVGQNIANVNTPGYSRQRAEFSSLSGIGGVEIANISRIADQFLTQQIYSDTSTFSRAQSFERLYNQLDNLLASDVTSVSIAMDKYFGALQTVVDDPISLPGRELFLAEADSLVRRFNDLGANLERQNRTVNGELESSIDQVNAIAQNIANLNDKLRIASAAGVQINELVDKREAELQRLAEYVDFTTIEQRGSNIVDVFIGQGEPLVIGQSANRLVATTDLNDSGRVNVALQTGTRSIIDVTDRISAGKIGGLIDYRSANLDRVRDEIGIIALTFAETMNQQHQKGMDLDGQLGGLIFNNLTGERSDRLLASGKNTGVASGSVSITDVTKLKASEYRVIFNESNGFNLVRESDGKIWNNNSLTNVAVNAVEADGQFSRDTSTGELTIRIDGIEIKLNPATDFAFGDSYKIQAARSAASDLRLELNDARQLALANPVKVESGFNNRGTGVALVEVTDITSTSFAAQSGELTPPLQVVFSETAGSLTYSIFDVTDPNSPVLYEMEPPIPPATSNPFAQDEPFTPGQSIELNGFKLTINNRPVMGDRFDIGYNTAGVSDNRNALAMSNLQQAKLLNGASYQDRYGQVVERVGSQTAVAQINSQSSKSVLDATIMQRDSIAGVNLDEEAAKLVQFQQAYIASSQIIRASQTIFDALISAV
ncbi:flagellar hook-associated protein FlgK [Nitrincola schmidtii]|uniref:flagellar hook-associated protein FlgK n=1 Tax=Nitrincola schmidtii TaxID=1730894 RepID=UPI00124D1ED8|nr:flagellar hook-associated protein FlgK [Nitrincola schmidtii]